MKNKGLFVLVLIFCFMYILNCLTPMLNEDYFSAFVWPEGIPNLGILPENARRVSSVADVFENCRVYYLTEGGRIPGGLLVGLLFWDLGKSYFNPVNALMMTLLVMEIYWLSHEGKITFTFNPSYLIWIFFCLWAFNVGFVDTCLWMSGSSNYLWMIVIQLAFLIPYVGNYYDSNLYQQDSNIFTLKMFIAGLLAGCSHETIICWAIVILGYGLYYYKKTLNLQSWKIFGYIGLCIGYAVLIFAPGNFARLAATSYYSSSDRKVIELFCILLFHFFLWYFILKNFIKHRKGKLTADADSHFILAKLYALIALGSLIIVFLIPFPGRRPSFLTLVYLIISACTLCRSQELFDISILTKGAASFLKMVGCCYLIATIVISLYASYIKWNHWNSIILKIVEKNDYYKHNILKVVQPFTKEQDLKLYFASGFHLVFFPVVSDDENDRINTNISKYYGIKGIKSIPDKQ